MGRNPACNCNCGNTGGNCTFSDNFSGAPSGYKTATTTAYGSAGSAPVFATNGGKLDLSNAASDVQGTFYQQVNLAASGLRNVSVSANVYDNGSTGKGAAGIFIGQICVLYAIWGLGIVEQGVNVTATGDNASGQTNLGSVASGDLLAAEVQETSPGNFSVTYLKNGSIIGTNQNAIIGPITNPVSVGLLASTAGPFGEPLGGDPRFGNFSVACVDTTACPLFASVPVVYEILGVATLNSASGIFPCTGCGGYTSNKFLYFLGSAAGGTHCQWGTAETFQCSGGGIGGGGSRTAYYWFLDVTASGATLYAGYTAAGALSIATYTVGTWNPLASNTLSLTGPTVGCQTFPSLIGVQPAP